MIKLKNPLTNETGFYQDSDAKYYLGKGYVYADDDEPVEEVKKEEKEEPSKEEYIPKKEKSKSRYESRYSSREAE